MKRDKILEVDKNFVLTAVEQYLKALSMIDDNTTVVGVQMFNNRSFHISTTED